MALVQTRDQALEVLAKWLAPTLAPTVQLEANWETWLRTHYAPWLSDSFGNPIEFAAHHHDIWEWVWAIRNGHKQDPMIACLPRGGAKSTTAEMACAVVAARRTRNYGLYVCSTQSQSDDHVQNVGALLESPKFAENYPAVANKRVNKYGYSSGWNRQRLRTASGFTIDSIGLDTAARGVKLEENRPDFLIFDDIDKELDTPEATEKKIKLITTALLPAGSRDAIVFMVQNLVIEDGVFARLCNLPSITKKADFLQNRIVVGPLPAIQNPEVLIPTGEEEDDYLRSRAGKYTIVGGTPIWEGQNLAKAQADIDEWGYTAWLTEAQQEVESPTDGLFGHIDFERITIPASQMPPLISTVVWCDPAVTDTKRSDSHGVIADSLGSDDKLYRQRAWEGRASPTFVLRMAIRWAIELGADHVGVETDQGGDLWELTYRKVWDEMLRDGDITPWQAKNPVGFRAEKAGAGYGSKAHRGSLMLKGYEADEVRHVLNEDGSHLILKRALLRAFVKKPFDLADAAFWGWNDLKGKAQAGIGAASDEPLTGYGTRTGSAMGQALHGRRADEAWTSSSDRMRVGRMWRNHAGQRSMWRGTPPQPNVEIDSAVVTAYRSVQGETPQNAD